MDTQPVLRPPGLLFGRATRYGLPVTVRAVPEDRSSGTFSLLLPIRSPIGQACPSWQRANSSPLLKQGAFFALQEREVVR
jgi:hypothetical protein